MEQLTDIAIFVQVVDSGSFTAAAEHLSLSKSVVSKYVSRLEERLGARLLNRTTRRLSLTEVGRVFYARSQAGLQELKEAEAEVSRLQAEPMGLLRINTPLSFGVLHIAPFMAEFQRCFPKIQLDMHLDDRLVDVIEGGFDVSIRIAEMADSSLVARRLGPCRHAIVASPGYLAQRGTPLQPAALDEHTILTYRYQSGGNEWHFLGQDGRQQAVPVTGQIQMNSSLALREAVLNGAGIARMPTFVVGGDIQQGRLVSLLRDYRTLEISIYAVLAQRRHLSPKVRAFVDFMAERITPQPYWD